MFQINKQIPLWCKTPQMGVPTIYNYSAPDNQSIAPGYLTQFRRLRTQTKAPDRETNPSLGAKGPTWLLLQKKNNAKPKELIHSSLLSPVIMHQTQSLKAQNKISSLFSNMFIQSQSYQFYIHQSARETNGEDKTWSYIHKRNLLVLKFHKASL